MMDSTVSVVPIERITFLTGRPFDEVVSDIYAGLGRTEDFGGLLKRWNAAGSRQEFDTITEGSRAQPG
jgi:hypothetical protein